MRALEVIVPTQLGARLLPLRRLSDTRVSRRPEASRCVCVCVATYVNHMLDNKLP